MTDAAYMVVRGVTGGIDGVVVSVPDAQLHRPVAGDVTASVVGEPNSPARPRTSPTCALGSVDTFP